VQTAEQIGGRLSGAVQAPQEAFGFWWRPAKLLVFFAEHVQRVGVGLELAIAGRAEEGRAVAAVVGPGWWREADAGDQVSARRVPGGVSPSRPRRVPTVERIF
jgi:hypothetical protein